MRCCSCCSYMKKSSSLQLGLSDILTYSQHDMVYCADSRYHNALKTVFRRVVHNSSYLLKEAIESSNLPCF